jgi:hypothetical protein
LALCAGLAGASARAQIVTGPARCTACHDHARQTRTWQFDEPARSGGRAHVNALARLDDAKAAGFARAIGLASAWSTDGACVSCHATVFRGGPNAGVSCESCHGPASGWIELHQTRGSYAKAVASGMRDLRDKPQAIAGLCVSCHVPTDARLVAAGHPSGAGFDAGSRLARIEHWTARYDAAQVSAAARALAPRIAAAAPATVTTAGSEGPPPPARAPVPGASWQDVRPLPSDYAPEPAASSPAARAGDPAPDLIQPAATTSVAEDVLHMPLPASPGARAVPMGPAGELLRLRGRGLLLLAAMLRDGQRIRVPAAGSGPAEFAGPESELLRLQDEIYTLLWAELGKPRP